MYKKFLKRYISDEFFINRTIISGISFLTLFSGYIVFDNPTIFSISLFAFCIFLIFQTYLTSRLYKAALGLSVLDAMIPVSAMSTLKHSTNAVKALEIVCKSYQPVFPVFYNSNLLGILSKDRFLANISGGFSDSYLADYTDKKFDYVYGEEDIQKLLSYGSLKKSKTMVVLDKANSFLGVLSYDKLIEFLLLDRVIKESKNKEVHDEFLL